MNKLICCMLLLLSLPVLADEFIVSEDEAFEPSGFSEFSDGATSGEAVPGPVGAEPALGEETYAEEKPASVVEEVITEAPPLKEEPEEMAVLPKAESEIAPMPPVTQSVAEMKSEAFNPRKGHWLSTFAFETINYNLPYDFKESSKEKYRFGEKKQSLYGGRAGFGREIYIGGGLMTSTRVEGYYLGTLFVKRKVIDVDGVEDPEEFTYTKDSGQIFGADAVQTLSYLFDFTATNPFMSETSNLVFEPFVEAGVGVAKAYNRKDYKFDAGTYEVYKHSFDDTLANVKLGAGFQITSAEGFFLTLKVSQNQYMITERNEKGFRQPNGGTGASFKDKKSNVSMDSITMYTLGGGYKF